MRYEATPEETAGDNMCDIYVSADPIHYEQRTRSMRIRGVVTSIRLENKFPDAGVYQLYARWCIPGMAQEQRARLSHKPRVVAIIEVTFSLGVFIVVLRHSKYKYK